MHGILLGHAMEAEIQGCGCAALNNISVHDAACARAVVVAGGAALWLARRLNQAARPTLSS